MPLSTLRGTEAIARFNRITCKITKKKERKELMIAREEIEWIDWESNKHKQHTAHSFPIITLFFLAWRFFLTRVQVLWKFWMNFSRKFRTLPTRDHYRDRDVKVGKNIFRYKLNWIYNIFRTGNHPCFSFRLLAIKKMRKTKNFPQSLVSAKEFREFL